jgi:aspartyl-tRNA(Asn)/glutamyl-tRNA(Gln) amidotransferase subunit A
MKLADLTAHELLGLYKNNETTPRAVLDACRQRIRDTDGNINAFVRLCDGPAAAENAGGDFPIPLAVKDNICVRGQEVTCGSRILQGFKPPYDATVIERLRSSGALILGAANMDEFAFGSSTESSFFGPTRNPWNTGCVPGGSSGGSTAAVAGGQAVWAIGSDTGGSIRQPASFCGVVGLKPTYGRVSRYGLIAFASSLDQIGPITKDVRDCALLLGIIAGHDPLDSTSARPEDIARFNAGRSGRSRAMSGDGHADKADYTAALINDVKGLKIGVPGEFFVEGMNPEVSSAVRKARDVLRDLGAEFVDVSLPHTRYAVSTYYIVATAEASSNLARFDGVQYGLRCHPEKLRKSALVDMYEETRARGFGDEVKRRVMLGTYALSSGYYDAYYLKGLKVRTLIKNDYDKVFQSCDAVLTPTAPTTAFRIGEKTSDPLSMYLSDIYTISANLAGIPAISVPCGFSRDGLPIGLQLMARPFDEKMLLRVAYTYEQNTSWHTRKPAL